MGTLTDNLELVPQTISKFPPMLLANWDRKVETETTYQTLITKSVDGQESRTSNTVRPQRFVMVRLTARDYSELSKLNALILRQAGQVTPVPIYSDIKPVTNQASNVLTVDTTYTRFQEDCRVGVFLVSAKDDTVDTVEYFTVDSLTGSSITLSGTPTSKADYQDMYVVPMMDCKVRLSKQRINGITDGVAYIDAPFKEYFDDSAYRPEYGYTPSLFLGIPVFEFEHNWANAYPVDIHGHGQETRIGKAMFTTVQGIRALQTFTLKSLFCSREDSLKFLSFFDYVKGRLAPFWFINPFTYWEISSTSSNIIYIEKNGLSPEDISDHFQFVYIENSSGDRTIYQVLLVDEDSGKIRIVVDRDIPADTYTFSAPVHYCRFGRDSIREVWTTDQVSEISYTISELLETPDFIGDGKWGGDELLRSLVVDGYWGGNDSNDTTDGYTGGEE